MLLLEDFLMKAFGILWMYINLLKAMKGYHKCNKILQSNSKDISQNKQLNTPKSPFKVDSKFFEISYIFDEPNIHNLAKRRNRSKETNDIFSKNTNNMSNMFSSNHSPQAKTSFIRQMKFRHTFKDNKLHKSTQPFYFSLGGKKRIIHSRHSNRKFQPIPSCQLKKQTQESNKTDLKAIIRSRIIDGDGLINLITDTEKLIAVNSVTYCDRSSSETRGQKSKSRITQNKTLKQQCKTADTKAKRKISSGDTPNRINFHTAMSKSYRPWSPNRAEEVHHLLDIQQFITIS